MGKTNKIHYLDGLKVSYNFPYALALHWCSYCYIPSFREIY